MFLVVIRAALKRNFKKIQLELCVAFNVHQPHEIVN